MMLALTLVQSLLCVCALALIIYKLGHQLSAKFGATLAAHRVNAQVFAFFRHFSLVH